MSTEINSPENKHTPGTKGEIWGEGRLGWITRNYVIQGKLCLTPDIEEQTERKPVPPPFLSVFCDGPPDNPNNSGLV